jgi:hypothetical protein
MIMRTLTILAAMLLAAGCASQRRASRAPSRPETPAAAAAINPATRVVETRYEMRAYKDVNDPAVRHEPHAVYRATQVPVRDGGNADALATVPRSTFQPASYAPLPQTTEMQAELKTQQQITSELRTIQTAMSATQKQAEQKFGELVNQTAETIRLRQQLEEERTRVKQLETSLRERGNDALPPSTAALATDMKW